MKTKRPHFCAAVVIGILLGFCNVALGQTAAPRPQTIIKKMVAQYAGASSYQDSGVVRILPGDPKLIAGSASPRFQTALFQERTLVSFKIYYARPRMFRFDWRSDFRRATRDASIWSDGKDIYSWAPDGETSRFIWEKKVNLRFSIDEIVGPSSGAVFLVPSLLMKGVSYDTFADHLNAMTELSLLKEETFDGEVCYVIRGKVFGTPWVLWVGKKSHLLRKTRTLYSSGSFHEKMEGRGKTFMAEEIHRDIRIDKGIPKEVFKYKPQLQPDDVDLTR